MLCNHVHDWNYIIKKSYAMTSGSWTWNFIPTEPPFSFRIMILYIFGIKNIYKVTISWAFGYKIMILYIFGIKSILK